MDNLKEIYYDPSKVGSFGGINALNKATKRKDAKEWLASQEVYSLHKPVRRKFKRRKTISVGIDHLWQIDLVDMTNLAVHNDGYKYLLTCIDCFSRYAWAVPIKNKNSKSVTEAFASLLNLRKPTFVQSDKGSEFVNTSFQNLLTANDIRHYTSENDDIKCALVERFNRTLKTRMWRYFTYTNSLRYIDVLPSLLKSYNASVHSAIKMAPSQVTVHNSHELRKEAVVSRKKPKLQVGDWVRISETKRQFKKGYLPSWTRELFKITQVHFTYPITYSICDYSDEAIKGKFYEQELQKVTPEEVFKIEKVVKTRKKHGKTEYLVRWLGYPSKFDSWVDTIV